MENKILKGERVKYYATTIIIHRLSKARFPVARIWTLARYDRQRKTD